MISGSSGALDAAFADLAGSYHVAPPQDQTTRRNNRLPFFSRTQDAKYPSELLTTSYDAIYSNTITNGARVRDFLAEYQLRPPPVITHVHELDHWIEQSGPENLADVKEQSQFYITASEAVSDCLAERYAFPRKDLTVVNEFISPREPDADLHCRSSSIRESLGIDTNALVVTCCGIEFWRKGRDLVPALMAAIKRIFRGDFHLIWLGNKGSRDEERRLHFDLDRLGLAERYHTPGSVTNPMDYFNAGNIFALLSRDDPFPLVCLENAWLGKPVVCFEKSGGMPAWVDKRCGAAVPYLDVEAMAAEIVAIHTDKQRYDFLSKEASSLVRQECHVTAAGPKIVNIIEEACGRRPPTTTGS